MVNLHGKCTGTYRLLLIHFHSIHRDRVYGRVPSGNNTDRDEKQIYSYRNRKDRNRGTKKLRKRQIQRKKSKVRKVDMKGYKQ